MFFVDFICFSVSAELLHVFAWVGYNRETLEVEANIEFQIPGIFSVCVYLSTEFYLVTLYSPYGNFFYSVITGNKRNICSLEIVEEMNYFGGKI